MRATRCRYRPRAWVWTRLAWPGSAAQGMPRRRQARQAVALRRPGKTRKVSPGFENYCTLLFFKVIHQISRSTWAKKSPILTRIERFRIVSQIVINDGFEMMGKVGCGREEVSYCLLRSSIKLQDQTRQKNTDFDPNWTFLDCNSKLNSPMALKRCTKLDVV